MTLGADRQDAPRDLPSLAAALGGTDAAGEAAADDATVIEDTTEDPEDEAPEEAAPDESDPNAAATAPPETATPETATSARRAPPPARPGSRGAVTNLPIPRYVSLKTSEGNARRGPSLSHRIDWVFRHPGMPLRVTGEYGHWRRVEDRDGAGGWVHYSLLSGVRTAVVTDDGVRLLRSPDIRAQVVALAERGTVGRLGECNLDWCEISAQGEEGWVRKDVLWGVDPDEIRD
ncbi:SH3 domain-containing protein [Phaeovulum vinaykumarii]